MTLAEALTALCSPSADRQRAAAMVRSALMSLSASSETRHEDAVQLVLMKLLGTAAKRPAPTSSDGVCLGYLRTLLERQTIDHDFRRIATRSLGAAATPLDRVTDEPRIRGSAGSLIETQDARALLDRAFARALADRSPRYRDSLEAPWSEVLDLWLGNVAMDDLLERELHQDEARETARDRLLQRHKRARDAVRAAVDAMEEDGSMDTEAAVETRIVLVSMLRCQRKPPGHVDRRGEERS